MIKYEVEKIATNFLMMNLQEWGQGKESKIEAINYVLKCVGFDARFTGQFLGNDSEKAGEFIEYLSSNLEQGKFQDEVKQLVQMIILKKEELGDI